MRSPDQQHPECSPDTRPSRVAPVIRSVAAGIAILLSGTADARELTDYGQQRLLADIRDEGPGPMRARALIRELEELQQQEDPPSREAIWIISIQVH